MSLVLYSPLQESFGPPIALILRFPDFNYRPLRLKSEDKGERFASPVPNFLSMALSPQSLNLHHSLGGQQNHYAKGRSAKRAKTLPTTKRLTCHGGLTAVSCHKFKIIHHIESVFLLLYKCIRCKFSDHSKLPLLQNNSASPR